MDELLRYINGLPEAEREQFAKRAGTTLGYIRKAASVKQRLRERVCIGIERESKGVIRCEMLRDDVDWSFLRGSKRERAKAA